MTQSEFVHSVYMEVVYNLARQAGVIVMLAQYSRSLRAAAVPCGG